MKKKIVLFICSLALLLTGVLAGTAYASTEFPDIPEGTNEDRIVSIINELGIMVGIDDEDGTRYFKPYQSVTRAEFVTAINNCVNNKANLNIDDDLLLDNGDFDWDKFFFGEDSEIGLMMPPGAEGTDEEAVFKGLFTDVGEEHWAYDNIRDIMIVGGVKGYGDGTFRPENAVSYNEAAKVILAVCGYDIYAQANGGWPDGYIKLATRFGLNKGITATGDEPMSRMDVATLIYNAFTLELAQTEIDENKDGKNFLNDIIDVEIVEATLISTDVTSIYGNEEETECSAVVGDTRFTFDTESDIRDYIGQEIRVFLKETDDGKFVLKSFEPTGGDNITEIDIALLESYENNQFNYYKTDRKGSLKKVKVEVGSQVIYNGKYLPDYDSETFEGLNQGTVKVIEKDDLDFDIIVVENFESGYTEAGYSEKSGGIVDRLKSGGSATSLITLNAKDGEEPIIYRAFDGEGNAIAADTIKGGAINYFVNDNYVKLYYTNNSVSGTVSGYNLEDGKTYWTVKDTEYPISQALLNYLGTASRQGVDVNAALDMYGEMVWLTENISTSGYVYFIKTMKDDENECLYFYYYDLDAQAVMQRVPTAGEVRYINSQNVTKKLSYEILYEDIRSYDGLLRLTMDDDGNIKKIEEPLEKSIDKVGVLKKIFETVSDSNSPNWTQRNIFYGTSYSGKFYADSRTRVLSVPNDREKYEDYGMTDSNLLRRDYPTKLYSEDADSPLAQLAVVYSEAANSSSLYPSDMPIYVVMSLSDGLDADGELADVAELYDITTGQSATIAATEDEDGESIFTKAMDSRGRLAEANYEVKKGDIVQIPIDDVTGKPIEVRCIYSEDSINPAWCIDDYTNRPMQCTGAGHTHDSGLEGLGTIPGSNGYTIDPARDYNGSSVIAEAYNTNPLQYGNGRAVGTPAQAVPGAGISVFCLGFIHSTRDDLLRITTQNLKDGMAKEDERFFWAYYSPTPNNQAAKVLIRTLNADGNYNISVGSVEDILTYEQVGSKCDEVLTWARSGNLSVILILRD